jgi:hypothetical protein
MPSTGGTGNAMEWTAHGRRAPAEQALSTSNGASAPPVQPATPYMTSMSQAVGVRDSEQRGRWRMLAWWVRGIASTMQEALQEA